MDCRPRYTPSTRLVIPNYKNYFDERRPNRTHSKNDKYISVLKNGSGISLPYRTMEIKFYHTHYAMYFCSCPARLSPFPIN